MTRALRRRRSTAGFTLVEALVATVVMALILGALGTITAQWLPNWNRGLLRVQRNEQVATALDRLVADLAAAEYVMPNRDVRRPLFDGGELGMTFVRSAIGPNTRHGLEIIRIGETADSLGPVLVRTRAQFVPLTTGDPALDAIPFSDPVVLLRAPLRVTFAYAGRDGIWKRTWRGVNTLPATVRIIVQDAVRGQTLSVSTAARVHAEMAALEPEQIEDAASDSQRSARDSSAGR
jgi:general secretion pathway protein J